MLKYLLPLVAIALAISLGAQASCPSLGGLKLVPTFNCLSVYLSFTGGDSNNFASVKWKKSGSTQWIDGPSMIRDGRAQVYSNTNLVDNPYVNQFRGSVVGLQAATSYDVQVTVFNSGTTQCTSVSATQSTRDDDFRVGSGLSYYVSSSGSDSATGRSTTTPFATISKALSVLRAGDTVYIMGGRYTEYPVMRVGGTQSNWITVSSYNSQEVIVDGQSTRSGFQIGQQTDSLQYIRITGLRFTNTIKDTLSICSQCSDIVVENCVFDSFSGSAIFAGARTGTSSSARLTIQNNKATRTVPKDMSTEGHFFNFWAPSGGQHVIRGNTLIDSSATVRVSGQYWDGISGGSNYGTYGWLARDSDVYNNVVSGMPDDGIESDGGAVNNRIWGNTITNAYIQLSANPVMIGPVYIFRNVLVQNAVNRQGCVKLGTNSNGIAFFYHNTMFAKDASVFSQTDKGLQNIVSRNNVLRSGVYPIEFTDTSGQTGMDFDYDALWSSDSTRFVKFQSVRYTSLSAFQAIGQEPHALTGELDSQLDANFKPKSTAYFLNKGTPLAGFNDANSPWPAVNGLPDIGAFEFGTSVATTTAPQLTTTRPQTTAPPPPQSTSQTPSQSTTAAPPPPSTQSTTTAAPSPSQTQSVTAAPTTRAPTVPPPPPSQSVTAAPTTRAPTVPPPPPSTQSTTTVSTTVSLPSFPDVPRTHPAYEAIGQLAARRIVRGYPDGTFRPDTSVLRAQMAAFICRAMRWDREQYSNPFKDQSGVDDALWRNVATLAHYGVAKGYWGDRCRAAGTSSPCFLPLEKVLKAQTISFITRAMVAKGYWRWQETDDASLYPNIASGHRRDVLTYFANVGSIPGTDPHSRWSDWSAASSRAWFSLALWKAYAPVSAPITRADSSDSSSSSSSSARVTILVVVGVTALTVILIAAAVLFVWKKRSDRSEQQYSLQPVNESA